jgi:hypothetical protein
MRSKLLDYPPFPYMVSQLRAQTDNGTGRGHLRAGEVPPLKCSHSEYFYYAVIQETIYVRFDATSNSRREIDLEESWACDALVSCDSAWWPEVA